MLKLNNLNFEISERKFLLAIFDIIFVFFFIYFSNNTLNINYITSDDISSVILLLFYIVFFGNVFEMYDLNIATNKYLIIKCIILTCIFSTFFLVITPYISPPLPQRRVKVVYLFSLIFLAILTWRIIYLKLFVSKKFNKNVLIIANANKYNELVSDIKNADPNYKIIALLNTNKSAFFEYNNLINVEIQNLNEIVSKNKITEILIDSKNKNNIDIEIYNHLLSFLEKGITIKDYSQVYEELTYKVPVNQLSKDFYMFFSFNRNNYNKLYKISTRIFDIIFSLIFLVFFIILLPFLIIGNSFANKGPLFYTQERVGRNGKNFNIIKLRSMVKNAESTGAVFAKKNDDRITSFGKFIRKTRIDEISQIFNILKGEMSVIGPRPERPVFVNQLAEKIPFYNTRHIIKPGLTGWAQVNYKYTENIEDSVTKLQYDLYYIKKRNIFIDINILIKTFSTVIYFKGQ